MIENFSTFLFIFSFIPSAWLCPIRLCILDDLPIFVQEFELRITVQINPAKNLALSGLYKSSSSGSPLLCTQCEAMGFRRITVQYLYVWKVIKTISLCKNDVYVVLFGSSGHFERLYCEDGGGKETVPAVAQQRK